MQQSRQTRLWRLSALRHALQALHAALGRLALAVALVEKRRVGAKARRRRPAAPEEQFFGLRVGG